MLWRWFAKSSWVLRLGLVVIIAGVLVGAGLFLSRKEYITRLFNSNASSIDEFIVQNSAGARAAYTFGALGAYDESPWLGVGLGASGFYIYEHLPDWSMTTVPEIARQLSPENRLYPNPKNMYARLLAETGLIGLFLFLAFQFSILGDVLTVLQKKNELLRFVAVAGLFSWFAILIYNFTQDSFAIPNIWINFGVLVGMTVFAAGADDTAQE
jgi:O-antigen ligase